MTTIAKYIPFPIHYFIYWLAAALFCFLPSWFLGWDFLLGSKDAVFYTVIMHLYGDAMAMGEFYPRWFSEANSGQGTPAMIFYSPLSYFITNSLLGWVDDPIGINRFIGGMLIAQILSGFTAYIWLHKKFEQRTALIFSVLYIILPYKMSHIWLHHNLAQLWVLVWLPLWMMSAERLLGKVREYDIFFYAICLALVAYTHLLTLIAFIAVPALYVLSQATTPFKERIIHLAIAHLFGFALCAAYFLPVLMNKEFVWTVGFLEANYNIFQHLTHLDTLFVAYYPLILVMIILMLRKDRNSANAPKTFWLFSGILAFFYIMTTTLSAPVWHFIPLLQYLQFPVARLHPVMLVAFLYVGAYGWEYWRNNVRSRFCKMYLPYAATLVIMICGAASAYASVLQLSCYTYKVFTKTSLHALHRMNAIPPIEYITMWSTPDKLTESFLNDTLSKPILYERSGNISADVQKKGLNQFQLRAQVTGDEATLVIKQWYFPGWEAVNTQGVPYPLSADDDTGYLQIALPNGTHDITLSIPWVMGEKAGAAISLMTLAAMVTMIVYARRTQV